MTKRTLEETLALIREDDSEYVRELCKLYAERDALWNIVVGARYRHKNLSSVFADSSDLHTKGAVYQSEYDLEVMEMTLRTYEVIIEEETEE